MNLRFAFGKIAVLLVAALLPLALVAPAHAAPKPKVSVKTASSSVAPGKTVKFTGTVSRSSAGAKVTVQRLTGKKWESIASGKVSKKKKYSLSARAVAGSHSYRIRVAKAKKTATTVSKTVKVSGTIRRSVTKPKKNQVFTLSAQLPTSVTRPVRVQRLVGGSWTNVITVDTENRGVASARLALNSTSDLRLYAPAATVSGKRYASWVSPRTTVKVAAETTVSASATQSKILADINAVRANAGKKPLKLHAHNSQVAYNWSKFLHDNEEFYHNPNYSKQISSGWTRAGENIAAGQTTSTVVEAWRNSPGHYKNMIGDFTHVGIGVFEGPNGYKRYFTTVFAKY